MESEHQRLLNAIQRIHQQIHSLESGLGKVYMTKESFDLYNSITATDLKNLGDKIRAIEVYIKELEKRSHSQEVKHTSLSTKVATIIGLTGGLGGLGALLGFIVRRLLE